MLTLRVGGAILSSSGRSYAYHAMAKPSIINSQTEIDTVHLNNLKIEQRPIYIGFYKDKPDFTLNF